MFQPLLGDKHLFSLDHALTVRGGVLARYRREPEIVRVHAEEAMALSEENGFREWLAWGRFNHDWALAEQGQLEQGVAEMEAGVAGFRRLSGVPWQQYTIALLARGYARMGRKEEALEMLNEALAHIEHSGERVDQAEMLRLKGELLLMRDGGATAEAEHCFSRGARRRCTCESDNPRGEGFAPIVGLRLLQSVRDAAPQTSPVRTSVMIVEPRSQCPPGRGNLLARRFAWRGT